MVYSTQNDILSLIDETSLIQLTEDKANIGAIDTSKVTRAIVDADATINTYCQGRYPVPLSPVPDKIRQISVDIAIYNLYSISDLGMPDIRKDRNKDAISFLRDVSKGSISLVADTPAEPSDGLPQTTRTKDDRIFSLGKKSDGSAGSLDNY